MRAVAVGGLVLQSAFVVGAVPSSSDGLNGEIIGLGTGYGGESHGFSKVFDGQTDTWFDCFGPDGTDIKSACWAGLELAVPTAIENVRFLIQIDGGRNFTVDGSTIASTGGKAVHLSGGNRSDLTVAQHSLVNSTVSEFSRTCWSYQPGLALTGVGVTARHNEISHGPHQAYGLGMITSSRATSSIMMLSSRPLTAKTMRAS